MVQPCGCIEVTKNEELIVRWGLTHRSTELVVECILCLHVSLLSESAHDDNEECAPLVVCHMVAQEYLFCSFVHSIN